VAEWRKGGVTMQAQHAVRKVAGLHEKRKQGRETPGNHSSHHGERDTEGRGHSGWGETKRMALWAFEWETPLRGEDNIVRKIACKVPK